MFPGSRENTPWRRGSGKPLPPTEIEPTTWGDSPPNPTTSWNPDNAYTHQSPRPESWEDSDTNKGRQPSEHKGESSDCPTHANEEHDSSNRIAEVWVRCSTGKRRQIWIRNRARNTVQSYELRHNIELPAEEFGRLVFDTIVRLAEQSAEGPTRRSNATPDRS